MRRCNPFHTAFACGRREFKLVLFNQHYLDIYGFPRKRVRKGMTIEAIVRLSSELGNHPDQSPDEFLALL